MTTRQQQSAYLQAMGIQAWETRVSQPVETSLVKTKVAEAVVEINPAAEIQVSKTQGNENLERDLPHRAPNREPRLEQHRVAPESIPPAQASSANDPKSGSLPPVGEEEPPMPTDDFMPSLDIHEIDGSVAAPAINVSALDWPALQTAVSGCAVCELHKSRTQTVFGAGNHSAEWMIIGEAPKVDEDQQGEPFVGDSGQLLNNMLRALGLKREQVFISNILKCRSSDDRDPQPAEIAQCEAYLQRQIALVAPKVILAVGAVAAHGLLKLKTPVKDLRGQLHHYGDTPVVVSYHPAYLLRKPSEKAKSWQDLRFAASVVNGTNATSGEQP